MAFLIQDPATGQYLTCPIHKKPGWTPNIVLANRFQTIQKAENYRQGNMKGWAQQFRARIVEIEDDQSVPRDVEEVPDAASASAFTEPQYIIWDPLTGEYLKHPYGKPAGWTMIREDAKLFALRSKAENYCRHNLRKYPGQERLQILTLQREVPYYASMEPEEPEFQDFPDYPEYSGYSDEDDVETAPAGPFFIFDPQTRQYLSGMRGSSPEWCGDSASAVQFKLKVRAENFLQNNMAAVPTRTRFLVLDSAEDVPEPEKEEVKTPGKGPALTYILLDCENNLYLAATPDLTISWTDQRSFVRQFKQRQKAENFLINNLRTYPSQSQIEILAMTTESEVEEVEEQPETSEPQQDPDQVDWEDVSYLFQEEELDDVDSTEE